jgi:hypothetical protein
MRVGKTNPMSWTDRIELYKQIEEHRKCPLLVYVTSKREGAATPMATDALPHLIEQLDLLPKKAKAIDLLVASLGGDPMVAWRIMSLLDQRFEKVSVLIPQSAYSAATLLAFGAHEIIMHPNGHIGPVDMQIATQARRWSTEDMTAFLDFVRDNLKITDQEHIRALFEITCKEMGSLAIGFTARSSRLAVDLAERLLALHMVTDEDRAKIPSIVENMSRKFQSHAYPVNRKEAAEIGLPINKVQDEKLEQLMWAAWLSIEKDLKEHYPFNPLHKVLNSAEAPKLLSPAPPLNVSMPPPPPEGSPTLTKDAQLCDIEGVKPVDFELQMATVESRRMAHICVTRGKILSCRAPDLEIKFNALTTFRGWEKHTAKTTKRGTKK